MSGLGKFHDIENQIGKHKNHNQALTLSMTMAIEVAVALEELGQAEEVKKLEEAIKEYVLMEEEVTAHITALSVVKDTLSHQPPHHDDQHEAPNLLIIYEEKLKELQESQAEDTSKFKKHPKYREFKQKVWAVNHQGEALPDEDEVVVMSQAGEFICPLSRAEMVDPMKNRQCGHSFSKVAIKGYLKGHGQKQCPVAGCNAFVSASTLERDLDLERKIKRHKRRNKNKDEDAEVEDL